MSARLLACLLVALCGAGLAAVLAGRPGPGGDAALPPPLVVDRAGPGIGARALSAEALSAEAAALPLRLSGRVAAAAPPGAGLRHRWPATEIRARFAGGTVLARFDDPVNRLRLRIDDVLELTLTRPGAMVVRIDGLGPGPHQATLEKIAESDAAATFGGFFAGHGSRPLPAPAPRARKIVFYGDSDTVGYGNRHVGRDCSQRAVFLSTDATRAFPALVARHFGADAEVIARSGLGLVRNYDGADPGRTLATLHRLALPDVPDAPAWGASAPADLVVLGIGSNDFSTPLRPDEAWPDAQALQAAFTAALIGLVAEVRADSPRARIVLLAFGEYGAGLVAAYRATFDTLVAQGAGAALAILPEPTRDACHWHPSLDDHATIAALVIAAVATLPDPW